jgi:hypothetical protein
MAKDLFSTMAEAIGPILGVAGKRVLEGAVDGAIHEAQTVLRNGASKLEELRPTPPQRSGDTIDIKIVEKPVTKSKPRRSGGRRTKS